MSVDNCIITKYSLSEREKELKRAFFSKKTENSKSSQNKQYSNVYEKEKSNFNLPENDELINKLIDRNLQELKTYESNLKQKNNFILDSTHHQIPLNLVYSQNKLLERNVDILHETQRSLHDLIIYNFHKDKQNLIKNSSYLPNQKILFELISPFLSKFDELKNSLNQIQSQISSDSITKNQNPQDKIKEFETKHNQLKENSHKFEKSLELLEKNKQLNKDNQILKAIEELKNSVNQINSEMNKMENEFSLNIKRIVEDNKFKSLLSGVNHSVNDTVSKLNSIANGKTFQKKNPDSLDYLDYQKDLLDINLRKEELLYEFKSKKIEFPNFSKIVTPKEKIEFSYKLHFENENCDKSTKMMNSATYLSEKESDNEKSGKNIFLNNLSHSVKTVKNNLDNEKLSNKNISSRINQIREENIHLTKTKSKSKDKQKNYQTNNTENQIHIQEIYESKRAENSEEKIKSSNLNNSNMNYNIEYSAIEYKPEKNVIERMRECKEKMKNYKSNSGSEGIDSISPMSINANYSTKNNTSDVSSEPSSAKYLKSSSVLKSKNHKLDKIEDKEITQRENQDVISMQLKQVENEMNTKIQNEPLSKKIKAIDVPPEEKIKSDVVHDLVLKLCIEKILYDKNKQKKIVENVSYVEKPQRIIDNILPVSSDSSQFKKIVEDVLTENIKNMIRTKRKYDRGILSNANYMTEENNDMNDLRSLSMIDKLKDENVKRENVIQNYLKDILNRFEAIEKNISCKNDDKKENKIIKEDSSILNLDEIVNKITDKIKGNMQINIHLANPIQDKRSPTNLLQTYNQSLLIEGVKHQIDFAKPDNEINDKSLNHLSTYSHPFAKTKNVDLQELEREIPLPYMLNLNEYEVSSATDLEISETNRTNPTKHYSNLIKIIPNRNESLSEGQLKDSKTDEETSRYITNMTNRTNQSGLYENKIKIIENINEKILNRGELKSQDMNSNYHYEQSNSNIDEYEENEESNSSSIEINVNKHIVNINDDDQLRKFNLYNSEEFNKFQKKFQNDLNESLNQNKLTSRMSEKGLGFNSFRFINFKNNSFEKEMTRQDNPSIINHYNTLNPNVLSFGNFISNKSSQQSNNLNSNSAKLIKISNEEMEDLIRRQNDVNNKLKIIAKNANENNTITENNSEMTTLKQMAESVSSQSEREYSKEKYNYKTDESSFVESYRNYSQNFN